MSHTQGLDNGRDSTGVHQSVDPYSSSQSTEGAVRPFDPPDHRFSTVAPLPGPIASGRKPMSLRPMPKAPADPNTPTIVIMLPKKDSFSPSVASASSTRASEIHSVAAASPRPATAPDGPTAEPSHPFSVIPIFFGGVHPPSGSALASAAAEAGLESGGDKGHDGRLELVLGHSSGVEEAATSHAWPSTAGAAYDKGNDSPALSAAESDCLSPLPHEKMGARNGTANSSIYTKPRVPNGSGSFAKHRQAVADRLLSTIEKSVDEDSTDDQVSR